MIWCFRDLGCKGQGTYRVWGFSGFLVSLTEVFGVSGLGGLCL